METKKERKSRIFGNKMKSISKRYEDSVLGKKDKKDDSNKIYADFPTLGAFGRNIIKEKK